jgi:hypothetical protein
MQNTNISQQTLMQNKIIIISENNHSDFLEFLISVKNVELGKFIRNLPDVKSFTRNFFQKLRVKFFTHFYRR